MRRGLLGSIAALVAGAGAAWGQGPAPTAPKSGPPAAIGPAGDVVPASGGPAPVIMPPVTVGPPGDPLGMGPTAGLGPPPGPMWPPPGPYGAPLFQPPPPGAAGAGGSGYGTAPRFWFEGNYMLGFVTPQPIGYPLLTTGSPNQDGVLGQPTTIALIPAKNINYGVVSGFRLGGGFYGDADRRFGFDMSAFSLGERQFKQRFTTDSIGSIGVPVLARPYIDATTGAQTSLVLIEPNTATILPGQNASVFGQVKFLSTTEAWGIDPNALWNVFRSGADAAWWMSFDVMAGYRHLEVNEVLRITSTTTIDGVATVPVFQPGPFGVPIQVGTQVVPLPVPFAGVPTVSPAVVGITDRFVATNSFNGGNLGFRHEVRRGMFSLTTTGKVAIGNMHQTLRVRGVTTYSNPRTGQNGFAFGGLYANPSTIGNFTNDEFVAIPEVNINIGINLTKSVNFFVGYNMIYIDNVIRPGSQLNPVIDPAVIPFGNTFGGGGGPPGTPVLVQKEYWIHAVNFGVRWRF